MRKSAFVMCVIAAMLVAGTAVFNDKGSVAENMARLRESAAQPTV